MALDKQVPRQKEAMVMDTNPGHPFVQQPLPSQLCNLDRLIYAMETRGLDGIVACTPWNMFYLTGFNGIAHKSDEPRPFAVLFARQKPDHPIIVIADYYLATFLANPCWIRDIRPFRAVMMPLDLPPKQEDIERFIPEAHSNVDWLVNSRDHYSFDMTNCLKTALQDLGLNQGKVGFDDIGLGLRLQLDNVTITDAYDPLMFARSVKTEQEITLLERATRLNETAITKTIASWDKSSTWRDLDNAYCHAVTELGGFVRDPGGMVWGHPRGTDPAIILNTGVNDSEVGEGTHVMFDCHGTLNLYCWDGGKTWVVGDEPSGAAKPIASATQVVAETLLEAMRPGAKISELQALSRAAYRKAGVSNADAAVIFFHGLGLSHMELELTHSDGRANSDWQLEEGMVVPMHLLYPGGATERYWLEEVVHVTKDGGRPLFSWGFGPLTE